jgi:hypothetical protein
MGAGLPLELPMTVRLENKEGSIITYVDCAIGLPVHVVA